MARMSKIPLAFGLLAISFLAIAVLPWAAHAGEVVGRIDIPAPQIKASLGTPGLLSAGDLAGAAADPVLIYVAEASGPLERTPTTDARLRIAGGKISPALIALGLGSVLTIENADGRPHRIVARSGPQPCDLGDLARGGVCRFEAKQTGVIPIRCGLHKDLSAEIVVLAHAAFTIVGGDGSYRLPQLPPGHATIVAYSPHLGEISREVEVPESGEVEVSFAF